MRRENQDKEPFCMVIRRQPKIEKCMDHPSNLLGWVDPGRGPDQPAVVLFDQLEARVLYLPGGFELLQFAVQKGYPGWMGLCGFLLKGLRQQSCCQEAAWWAGLVPSLA